MLSTEELRVFSRINPWISGFWILATWLMISATFAIAIIYPYWWVIFLAIILMARHQISLAILMHDAAHKRLFTNPNWNDYVSQLLLAAPVFFNVMAYRTFHIKHHKAPLAADDPDISLIGGYPVSRQSFVRKILRDLSGFSYFKFIRYFISRARAERGRAVRSDGKRSGPSALMANIMIFAMNALLAVILARAGALWAYFLLWLLPSLTVLQVLLRIRGITEHAGYAPNPDQRFNARTVVNPWQTFFFAPNGVNYHIEHHLYPSVPWYNLANVHKLLLARGVLPAKNCYTSYAQVIRELVR